MMEVRCPLRLNTGIACKCAHGGLHKAAPQVEAGWRRARRGERPRSGVSEGMVLRD